MATLLAGDLIDEARDHHISFDFEEFPQKMVLRQLSRALREFYAEVTEINESCLAEVVSLTSAEIATALSAGSYTMPDNIRVLDADARLASSEKRVPVFIYASAHRLDTIHFPAIYLMGQGAVRLTSQSEQSGWSASGWDDFQDLRIWYVPVPTAVTSSSDTITLPGFVQDALVSYLVRFMAGRKGREVMMDLQGVLDQVDNNWARAVNAMAIQNQSEHGNVQMTVDF